LPIIELKRRELFVFPRGILEHGHVDGGVKAIEKEFIRRSELLIA
jgi:hypothetical protein